MPSRGPTRAPRRHKLPKKASKRMFTKTAQNVRAENLRALPMRGGIRL